MKKAIVGKLSLLVLAAWLLPGSSALAADSAKPEAAAPAEKPDKKESPLHLPPAKREAAGIVLSKSAAATLMPEVMAYGRVLDPAPLAVLVAEQEAARAALGASEKEFARAAKLYAAEANSVRAGVEAAEAAMKRDRAALGSVRARLIAGWGRRLVDTADLSQLVESLEKDSALARLDLLPGDSLATELKTARVGLLGGGELVEAEVLGPAPAADPQVQGASYLVMVREHPLPAGAALRGIVSGPGEPAKVVVVPRSAVVYHLGSAWVYVLGAGDTFERKIVTLGRTVGDGVAILSGLEESEQIVATGAGQLLSAELQAGGAPDEG